MRFRTAGIAACEAEESWFDDAAARIANLLPESDPKPIQTGEWTVERAMENPFVGKPEESGVPR